MSYKIQEKCWHKLSTLNEWIHQTNFMCERKMLFQLEVFFSFFCFRYHLRRIEKAFTVGKKENEYAWKSFCKKKKEELIEICSFFRARECVSLCILMNVIFQRIQRHKHQNCNNFWHRTTPNWSKAFDWAYIFLSISWKCANKLCVCAHHIHTLNTKVISFMNIAYKLT